MHILQSDRPHSSGGSGDETRLVPGWSGATRQWCHSGHTCHVLWLACKDYGFTRKIKNMAIGEQTIWFSVYLDSQLFSLVVFISFL